MPKRSSVSLLLTQAIQVKVHHSAPSLEVCAELDNLKADASPATLGRLNGLCTLTMFACARKGKHDLCFGQPLSLPPRYCGTRSGRERRVGWVRERAAAQGG